MKETAAVPNYPEKRSFFSCALQLAKIRVKTIELSEDLDGKIAGKDFSGAAEIQELLDALRERKRDLELEMQPKTVDKQDDAPTELSVSLDEIVVVLWSCLILP